MKAVISRIKDHALSQGDSPAIIGTQGEFFSYKALLEQIEALGSELQSRGISHDDRIALVLKDGPAMAVSFLAVSSVCTSAPLNTAYKARDFQFYLDDLQAKAVILEEGQESEAIEVAAEKNIPVWRLQTTTTDGQVQYQLADSNETTAGCTFAPIEKVSMILHTSGTTSRPKMVPLTQENLATSAKNVSETLKLTAEDRGIVVMPLFHIHGLVGALLSAIYAGSSVVCTPGFESCNFMRWSLEHSATWYSAVPTMHQALLNHARENPADVEGLTFKVVRSSSASLPPKVFHDLVELWKAPVIESYGMTEAAHQMTSNPLPPQEQKPGSVGLPAGPEVAIMNEDGEFIPTGQTGAIVIKGANVTSGYANNHEANATAYTDGWFQTGDQGYFDDDGYLFLTGRLKEMINRGGENIAPREIDEVLLEHPAINQATAFAIPHETLGEDLAAAVVLKEGMQATEPELRTYVAEQLADFKVPNRVLIVDSIPKGPTGKLQRIGLHEKLQEYLKTDYVSPRNETETAVAGIFGSVLGKEDVSVLENFFFLGGDSLKGMRVISSIKSSFTGDLSLNAVFKYPTVELLSKHIEETMTPMDDDLAALEQELAGLSDEEIERLLSEEESD
ncbi:MAG: AMP-binding protein [Puniceicoccaceae bacterium]